MPRRTPHARVLILLAASLIVAPRAARADAVVLTFGPACTIGQAENRGTTVFESGFQVVSTATMQSFCTSSPNYAAPALFVNALGGGATLSAVNNSPFSISSIDLANLFAGQSIPATILFVGHIPGGGIVMQSFSFATAAAAPPVFATFNFPSTFANLTSLDLPLQVSMNNPGTLYQFTNVRLNATSVAPEPGSMLLVLTGLIGVVAVKSRVRKGLRTRPVSV